MSDDSNSLLEQALRAADLQARHHAFLALLRLDTAWPSALTSEALAAQTHLIRGMYQPHLATMRAAAELIAQDEEKIQCVLALVGAPGSEALVLALARHMREAFVEHALSHLRTAEESYRRLLLQRALTEAHAQWVTNPAAAPIIRRQLRMTGGSRLELSEALVRNGMISELVSALREVLPCSPEEWNALGKAAAYDDTLYAHAMRELVRGPAPLLYLARLSPLPEAVIGRMLSAAAADWTVAALELAVVHGLDSAVILPLAMLSIRRGGPGLAFGMAWISSAKLARRLLAALAEHLLRGGSEAVVDEMLRYRAMLPAPNRALNRARQGAAPSVDDAAALVRQLEGERARTIVREVLTDGREELVESVLHHLCALRPEAAAEVMLLSRDSSAEIAARAQKLREWTDIYWGNELDQPTTRLEAQ